MSVLPTFSLNWLMACGPALLFGLAILFVQVRRMQIRDLVKGKRELAEAVKSGTHNARLQHPKIDLTNCIGCGACVRACPEEGVLAILNGQAAVVHGARCVGHGLCAAACPTAAISLTLGDLSKRRDIPAVTSEFEAVGLPGLFIAGELSGFALVRTAVAHGVAVADAVAQRLSHDPGRSKSAPLDSGRGSVLDFVIVGAGPGGLACSLRAKEKKLNFLTLDQEPKLGGTVSAYPRKKMVMTQPVDLPLHGKLEKVTYQKEELVSLWEQIAEKYKLPIRLGVKLRDVRREPDGIYCVTTSAGTMHAKNVCLALGRRGSPRKLGVLGEDLPKVAYAMLDAESYQNRRILIVGGGDSAVEAALGLCDQPGNEVTVSYRKAEFTRIKSRNASRMTKAIHAGRVRVLFETEVVQITPEAVRIALKSAVHRMVPNDDVFIFAGGDPPFELLEHAGVSFDPADMAKAKASEVQSQRTGLLSSLSLTFLVAIALGVWGIWFGSYYSMEVDMRFMSRFHPFLKPSGPIGLMAGLVAVALFVCNLAYLIRRSFRWGRILPGTLRDWMGWHIVTGLISLPIVLLHAGFTASPTVGGHALLALAIVVLSGSVGRYFYALIPHAANGTEADYESLRIQMASISTEWDRSGRGFGTRVRDEMDQLISQGRWQPSFFARVRMVLGGYFRMERTLKKLRNVGRLEGIPVREISNVLYLARRGYRLNLLVTHYEEITALVSSWRYVHRWLGLLLILLTIAHVVTAAQYATLDLNFVRAIRALTGRAP